MSKAKPSIDSVRRHAWAARQHAREAARQSLFLTHRNALGVDVAHALDRIDHAVQGAARAALDAEHEAQNIAYGPHRTEAGGHAEAAARAALRAAGEACVAIDSARRAGFGVEAEKLVISEQEARRSASYATERANYDRRFERTMPQVEKTARRRGLLCVAKDDATDAAEYAYHLVTILQARPDAEARAVDFARSALRRATACATEANNTNGHLKAIRWATEAGAALEELAEWFRVAFRRPVKDDSVARDLQDGNVTPGAGRPVLDGRPKLH